MRVSSRLSAVAFFCASLLLSTSFAAGCGDSKDPNGIGAGGSIPREIACKSSADCSAPLSHCSTSGACVACLETKDCEAGFCDELNRCVSCLEDDHCENGVCSPDGHCLGCMTGEDCASGHCLENECLPEGMCTATAPCEEGFRCISYSTGATRGMCEAECDVLAENPCEDGLLCALHSFDDDGNPLATCVEPTGGAQEQESCRSEEVTCEANLVCVSRTSMDVRCSTICDFESETPRCAEGSSCEKVSFKSGEAIGVCIADEIPCTNNDACPEGERCSITEDGDQICIQAVGPKQGGDQCSSGLECDAGICLGDFCFGACADADACFEGGACLHRFLSDGGSKHWFIPVCVPTCATDADCDADEFCGYETSSLPPAFVGTCNAAVGTLGNGEDCSTHNACRSRNCISQPDGYCGGRCETAEDCGPRTTCVETLARMGSGEDERYNTEDDLVGVQRICAPHECINDSECPGDWVCKPEELVGSTPSATLTLRCGPKAGTAAAGASCDNDHDCETGRCIKNKDVEGTPFCFGACEMADAECQEGLRCVQEEAEIHYGLGQVATYAACVQ